MTLPPHTPPAPATGGLAFEVLAVDGITKARRGRLRLARTVVETPVFMPVGTQATVKALGVDDLENAGAAILLANSYHLMLRPGEDLVRGLGGLHHFMSWKRGLLTDSGGFQVYSLSERRKITDDGIHFRSHLDGSHQFLNPARAMAVQEALGADIIMALDECPPSGADEAAMLSAMARTTRWLDQCVAAWSRNGQALFGIVQGGLSARLRRQHAEEVCARGLPGYALGGFSVGEQPPAMHEGVYSSAPLLPPDRPRYLMGVGSPVDLLHAVAAGMDMFDCVLPTRTARNGLLFTWQGKVHIKSARYARDARPVDERCGCVACRGYTRAYLRHLVVADELLAYRLNSAHNVYFYLDLMRRIRESVEAGTFGQFMTDALPLLSATDSNDDGN